MLTITGIPELRIRELQVSITARSMSSCAARCFRRRSGVGERHQKNGLLFAGGADPFFHLVEVLRQGAAAGGGEAIFGARDASFEKLYAGDVLRLFELAGVDAQIAVRGLEYAFEIVEAERLVSGESAHDSQANALVNQAIEFREFEGMRGSALARGGFELGVLAAVW